MNKPGMINGLCQGDFLGFCLNKFLCLLDETFLLSFFFFVFEGHFKFSSRCLKLKLSYL